MRIAIVLGLVTVVSTSAFAGKVADQQRRAVLRNLNRGIGGIVPDVKPWSLKFAQPTSAKKRAFVAHYRLNDHDPLQATTTEVTREGVFEPKTNEISYSKITSISDGGGQRNIQIFEDSSKTKRRAPSKR